MTPKMNLQGRKSGGNRRRRQKNRTEGLYECRTKEMADKSEIRQIAYTPQQVMDLFAAFRAEVNKTLIFLKVGYHSNGEDVADAFHGTQRTLKPPLAGGQANPLQ